jgi:hypothetical protein
MATSRNVIFDFWFHGETYEPLDIGKPMRNCAWAYLDHNSTHKLCMELFHTQ